MGGYQQGHSPSDYNKGDFIYMAGDQAQRIYLIAEGKVKIGYYTDEGKEVIKAILGKGELFGELALLGEETRSDFAVAQEPTNLCPLDLDTLQELMLENKNFSLKIRKLIGYRFRKLERRLELLVFKDVRTRLVEFIRELAAEKGQKVGMETLVKHPFTQKDIADLIGSSRQTVTQLMNEMRDQNLINFSRKRLLIRDLESFR